MEHIVGRQARDDGRQRLPAFDPLSEPGFIVELVSIGIQ